MTRLSKPVLVVGFVLSVILVSRYLYLFTLRDSDSFAQAGNYGLWLTGAAVITCITGGLMFYFFLRHDDKSSTTHGFIGPATAPARDALTVTSTTPKPFDIKRWENLNPWLIEGQPDDRIPMLGAASNGNGSLSARRSTARRAHQMMFKKWSQARHD